MNTAHEAELLRRLAPLRARWKRAAALALVCIACWAMLLADLRLSWTPDAPACFVRVDGSRLIVGHARGRMHFGWVERPTFEVLLLPQIHAVVVDAGPVMFLSGVVGVPLFFVRTKDLVSAWLHLRRFRRTDGRCAACGYDLSGLPQDRPCPECGARAFEGAKDAAT